MAKTLSPEHTASKYARQVLATGAVVAVFGVVALPGNVPVGGGILGVAAALLTLGAAWWRTAKRLVVEIASYDGKQLRGTLSGPLVASAQSLQVNVKTVGAKVFTGMRIEGTLDDAQRHLAETGRTEKTLGTDHATFNAPATDNVRFQLAVTPLSTDPLASDYVELLVTVDPKDGSERWARTYRVPRP